MSRHQSAPVKTTATAAGYWSLEVVRGRKPGASYGLGPGETVVGNALLGAPGLDLAEQEGETPRRMAGRHAVLATTGRELSIRDLDTPGGTFVNRQRLLSGQVRTLEPDDIIQLAGVQLQVKHAAATGAGAATARSVEARAATAPVPHSGSPLAQPAVTAARPAAVPAPVVNAPPHGQPAAAHARLPAPFVFAGAHCRTWDDFLVRAAQNWPALCAELTSGRLAEYLGRIGRTDLLPHTPAGRSPDDQLDDWLARIPATESSAPSLDVHPETVVVSAVGGGGMTRHVLRITNVGYRLLKCTARVEPADAHWLRLPPEQDRRPFQTIEQTDLAVEVELPDVLVRPLQASIVIESNGGTRRIAVRIERPAEEVVIPDGASGGAVGAISPVFIEHFKTWFARLAPPARVGVLCAALVLVRIGMMAVNILPIGARGENPLAPRLATLAIVFVALGALAGARLALNRGDGRDLAVAGFAGGVCGLLSAAGLFAVVQAAERLLGSWSTSFWAIALLWVVIGALGALVSIVLVPHRATNPEAAQ